MERLNLKTKLYQKNLTVQYKNILHYKINKNKITYLNKVYKNYINIFFKNFETIRLLYKKNYELFAYDFILRDQCSMYESTHCLLSCLVNNNKKKSLYSYKKIKKTTKNHIFLLNILHNETNKLNKKMENNEKLIFNFEMLDMYIKTEKIEEFWINLFEIINLILFKKNSIKNNKNYDRFDIKPLI